MNLLIDGEKILKAGYINYEPIGTQEVKQINDSDWKGYNKSEIKWNGTKIIKKTQEELDTELQSKNAKIKLNELDKKLPRGIEDLYTSLKLKGLISDSDLPEEFLNNYNQKITERAKL